MTLQNNIPVIPINGPTINSVTLEIYNLILNYGFTCACYLKDLNGNLLQRIDVNITGDEYNSWSNDDEMISLILSKINLQPSS